MALKLLSRNVALCLALSSCWVHGQKATETLDLPEPHAVPIVAAAEKPVGDEFSFLVGGHLYGQPGVQSAMPSPTLVAVAEDLALQGDAFFVSCGDFVRAYVALVAEPTEYVLSQLEMPVYNAPGNHDWSDDYRAKHALGYGCFRRGSGLFVLLNSELEPWQLAGPQLEFIRRVVDYARDEPAVEQVFFFAHKVVFAAHNERYRVLFEHANAKDGFKGVSNFAGEVQPLLVPLAKRKKVYWFAGDIGVEWSRSVFYDHDPGSGVTYLAVGLGATRRDCLLRVRLRTGKDVEFELLPLAAGVAVGVGEPVAGRVEDYGLDWWREQFK